MQPSDLESAVKRQSWEWLFDLPPRLNVAIEVIDAELVPVFPPGSTRAAAELRRILTSREPSLVSAISNAARSETPAGAEADGLLQVLCFRLSQGGVLVLARELSGSASNARQDLELVGSWLTGVIEATSQNRQTPSASKPTELRRFSASSRKPYLEARLAKSLGHSSRRSAYGITSDSVFTWLARAEGSSPTCPQ